MAKGMIPKRKKKGTMGFIYKSKNDRGKKMKSKSPTNDVLGNSVLLISKHASPSLNCQRLV